MIMKNYLIILTLSLLTFISCKPDEKELLEKINTIESTYNDKIKEPGGFKISIDLLALYQDYIKYYPEGKDLKNFYYRAGNIAMDIRENAVAIDYLSKFSEMETDVNKIAQAQFYIAFIYENHISDLENAEIKYKEIIEKYSQTEYAEKSKDALKIFGKTSQELIESFSADSVNKDTTIQ